MKKAILNLALMAAIMAPASTLASNEKYICIVRPEISRTCVREELVCPFGCYDRCVQYSVQTHWMVEGTDKDGKRASGGVFATSQEATNQLNHLIEIGVCR